MSAGNVEAVRQIYRLRGERNNNAARKPLAPEIAVRFAWFNDADSALEAAGIAR